MKYHNDIHGVVKINSNIPFLGYEIGEVQDPDITIEVKKDVNFPTKKLSRLDFWFYGKEGEDVVYYEDTFFGVKNKVLLKNLNGKTEIYVTESTLTLDRFYPPRSRKSFDDLVNNIIRVKQIEKGYLNVHAACLSKGDSAVLFAAFPNVGKTLSTLQLLKKGYKYMSDDTVLLDKNGTAYLTSFPSAIGYEDFLKFVKPSDLGFLKYYKILIKSYPTAKSKVLNRLIRPPLISLGDIFETVGESKVTTVCSLEIGERKIKEVDKTYMTEKITSINDYSLSRINNPFIFVYSYFNDFSVTEIETLEKQNLSNFLEKSKCYSLASNDWDWLSIFKEIGVM